jgi:hypothetical protein
MELREEPGSLEIVSPLAGGTRVFFALAAIVPLIAPYGLLLKPGWSSVGSLAFLLAALISLGALAVSAACLLAALAGLTQRMRFEASPPAFTYTAMAPVLRPRVVRLPLDQVLGVEVATRTWSDGPDTYSLEVSTPDERFSTTSVSDRLLVEDAVARVRSFIGLASSAS